MRSLAAWLGQLLGCLRAQRSRLRAARLRESALGHWGLHQGSELGLAGLSLPWGVSGRETGWPPWWSLSGAS